MSAVFTLRFFSVHDRGDGDLLGALVAHDAGKRLAIFQRQQGALKARRDASSLARRSDFEDQAFGPWNCGATSGRGRSCRLCRSTVWQRMQPASGFFAKTARPASASPPSRHSRKRLSGSFDFAQRAFALGEAGFQRGVVSIRGGFKKIEPDRRREFARVVAVELREEELVCLRVGMRGEPRERLSPRAEAAIFQDCGFFSEGAFGSDSARPAVWLHPSADECQRASAAVRGERMNS